MEEINREIVVVSGLPRSGTSLMMAMLQAAGLELLVDGVREADPDNPRGYYEYEKVKGLQRDNSWLLEAEGRVVKVVSALLPFLPMEFRYRVVFMERELAEIIASQNAMLRRSGRQAAAADDKMAALYRNHLAKTKEWLAARDEVSAHFVSFNRLLQPHPEEEVAGLAAFLGGRLAPERLLSAVDRTLYRNRRARD